ncbi:hypothetical protein [Cellulomonas sp. PS-H5]|uniref:hypothetical protein n=1 Tax=Cellulomonas sp. PS-H5 TaxID=2820400 RepID=UPI001C4F9060|nr:hypothetical protein [Cellulomonas sp. PS-H5]MBW0254836.1 hypothetical protein [Cellulomonas sp. PS-H5]
MTPRGAGDVTGARLPVRQRLATLAVFALVLVAGTVATAAAFTDAAHLDLGTAGIGSADPFAIVLVDAGGLAHDAEPGTPMPVDVPDRDALVPGRTVQAEVRVASNHPALAADVRATVAGEPVAGTPDVTPYLRITVLGPGGVVLLGSGADAPEGGAVLGTPADLGVLAARGAGPVGDGQPWTAGAAGSDTTLTILVHYLDDSATTALNGGQARLTVRFDATSVAVA